MRKWSAISPSHRPGAGYRSGTDVSSRSRPAAAYEKLQTLIQEVVNQPAEVIERAKKFLAN